MSARIRHLEVIASEWERVFSNPSPDMLRAGISKSGPRSTPAFVAQRLVELASSTAAGDSPDAALIATLQAELHNSHLALRDSSRIAREQAAQDILRTRKEADAAVAAERQARMAAEAGFAGEQERSATVLARQLHEARTEASHHLEREVRVAADRHAEEARAWEAEREALRADLAAAQQDASRLSSELAALSSEHAAESSRLSRDCECTLRDLESTRREAAAQLEAAHADWAARLHDAEDRFLRCTATQRVRGMEGELEFLRRRQAELEDVVVALQSALRAREVAPAASRPMREFSSNLHQPTASSSAAAPHERTVHVFHAGAAKAAAAALKHGISLSTCGRPGENRGPLPGVRPAAFLPSSRHTRPAVEPLSPRVSVQRHLPGVGTAYVIS